MKTRFVLLFLLMTGAVIAQVDTSKEKQYKNVIRYNLSSAMVFGIDKYIVFGYERVIAPRQSFSVNLGRASMPKITSLLTDSFSVEKDQKRSGYNISVDYRFYLARENKYLPPHGFYVGPYYSYNHFETENDWIHKNNNASNNITSKTNFNINTIGFELGYQLILWKRFAIDLVMVGPGLGFYKYKATFDGNIDPAKKEQLFDGLKQLLVQKYPGMNFVFSDTEIESDGVMTKSTIGYRYLIQIGFVF